MTSFVRELASIVRRTPDAPALVNHGRVVLRYRELWSRSAQTAAELARRGAGPEALIGVAIPKSIEYVVALVAVWMCRAGFVPLDPALPAGRLRHMLRDGKVERIVATDHAVLPRELKALDCVVLANEARSEVDFAVDAGFDPEALAYVIYTSGSTGTPKGVAVPQRGIHNLLSAQIRAFELGPGKRALLYLSTQFDASVSDIGTTLMSGAALYFEPEARLANPSELCDIIRQRGITHLDLPPAVLRLLDPEHIPVCLETLVLGGEPSPPELIRRFAKRLRVVNVYGPTEATVCASLCLCDRDTWSKPLLGAPLPGVQFRVLDAAFEACPVGEVGELFIGGIGLARGYLNLPALNAARFVHVAGERLYRTGDRVRLHNDGSIEFVGRIDRQLKVRGMLLAPEEVEAQLRTHPSVSEAMLVPRNLNGRRVLVAHVQPHDAKLERAHLIRALREHLRAALPEWMQPDEWQFAAVLPRGASGKIDIEAVRNTPLREAETKSTPPSNTVEQALHGLWQRVLGKRAFGIDDDFFELGGSSLGVIEMLVLAEHAGLPLSSEIVMGERSIRRIAASVTHAASRNAQRAAWLRADVEPSGALRARLARAARVTETSAVPEAVLLTGATGFLGSYVLTELLERTTARVHCLVRADSSAVARARIGAALAAHGRRRGSPWTRILPVCGDLTLPELGLQHDRWLELAHSVGRIFHIAAAVDLVRPYSEMRAANVGGTEQVLQLMCEGCPKRLHYASTLSVFVATERNVGVARESDELEATRTVYGGYAQTKWACEALLCHAAPHLEPIVRYRLGLITGDTETGYFPERDLLGLFLRGLVQLGCAPEDGAELRVDVTPVDVAAAAMVALSTTCSPVHHIANRRGASLEELVEALRSHGVRVSWVSRTQWLERVALLRHSGPGVAAAHLALAQRMLEAPRPEHRAFDLFQATDMDFDTDRTRARLVELGIHFPAPNLDLLARYVGRALSHEPQARPTFAGDARP